MRKIKNILCFCLFAIFPALAVYFRNKSFIFEGGLVPLLSVILLPLTLLYFLLGLLNKKPNNNVVICIIVAWWFLLYGHIYYRILDYFDLPYSSFRHRYFVPGYSLLFFCIVYVVWKANQFTDKLISIFFTIGIVLNFQFAWDATTDIIRKDASHKQEDIEHKVFRDDMPDVYYIVMDSYPCTENLQKYYNYNNEYFIGELKKIGFQVVDHAKSNYPYTYFSLSSSLNMEYINYFEDSVSVKKGNENYPFTKIRHNKVADYFKRKGYKYVVFASAYEELNDKGQADIYINNRLSINSFHESIIQLSLLNCLNLEFYSQGVYNLCSNSLKLFPNTPDIKGSKLVFFHCFPPHPPNVFDAKGNYRYSDENVENRYAQKIQYADQVHFISTSMLEIVKNILVRSKQAPLIILQGDHGSASSERYEDERKWAEYPSREILMERFGILNAIYVPEKYKLSLPTEHTPVNTFRLVINSLFDDSLPTLPTRHYFARYRTPFNFREVNWPAVEGLTNDSLVIKKTHHSQHDLSN